LIVEELEHRLRFTLRYKTAVFDRASVENFSKYFKAIAEEIISAKEVKLSAIKLAPVSERAAQIMHFNEDLEAL
jgi:hypothetical protein